MTGLVRRHFLLLTVQVKTNWLHKMHVAFDLHPWQLLQFLHEYLAPVRCKQVLAAQDAWSL